MININIFSKFRMRVKQNHKLILFSFLFLFSTQFIHAYDRYDTISACIGSTLNVDGIDYTLREDTAFQYTILGIEYGPTRLGQQVNRVLAQQAIEDTIVYLFVDVLSLESKTIDTAICAGSTINIDGVDYKPAADTAVEYVITGENGDCDTNATVNITIRALETKTIDTAICAGSTINIDGVDYTPAADTAVEYVITGENGDCDTNATVNITIRALESKTIDTAICAGSTINIDGVDYTPAADTAVEYVITGENGDCDTNATVNITIRALETKTIDTAICTGSTINVDGVDYTPVADTAVEYVITGENGDCDTNATVSITIRALETKTIDTAICAGSTINIDDVDYTPAADTAVEYIITGENGDCDTNVTVNITIRALETLLVDTTNNIGEVITINGVDYSPISDTSVIYILPALVSEDCDTVVTVNIDAILLPPSVVIADTIICKGAKTSVTASGIPNAQMTWYADSMLNNPIQVGSLLVTPFLDSSITYYVTQTVYGLTSQPTIAIITVQEYSLEPVLTIPAGLICQSTDVTVTSSSAATIFYSDAGFTVIGTGSELILDSIQSSIIIYAKDTTNSMCPSKLVSVKINVEPKLSKPNVSNTVICSGRTATLTGASAITHWYDDSLLTNEINLGASYTTPILEDTTTYYLRNEDVNKCASDVTVVTVVVNKRPEKPIVGEASTCYGQFATIVVQGENIKWFSDSALTNLVFFGTTLNTPILYRDTVYFVTQTQNNCQSDSSTVHVKVFTKPDRPIINSVPVICVGSELNLTVLNEQEGQVYNWVGPNNFTSNETNPKIENVTLAAAGTYTVYASLGNCKSDIATTIVYVNQNPTADAGADVTIFQNQSIMLQGSGGQIYSWTPDDNLSTNNISNPIFMSEEIGVYEIELTVWDGGFGCLDKDTVVVTVVPVEKLIIPDIITPNGDNVNDEWVIQYLENVGSPYTLSVYARGGAMVMNTTSYNQQWRGTYNDKELHDGAYWYVLEFENGIIYKGTLTIKR
jgi:gliding motility-associated-like protein